MPDLANRAEHERAIAAAILLLFDDWTDDAAAGRFRPRVFRSQLSGVLAPLLSDVHAAASRNLTTSRRFDGLSDRQRDRAATRWGEREADRLARQLTRTTRQNVERALQQRRTIEETRAILDRTFGRDRAADIGITSTTTGVSRGEGDAAEVIRRDTGLVMMPIWTIEDSAACKICKALDGMTESVWGREFPGGPPAHPSCRCWLEYGEPHGRGFRVRRF